MTQWKCTICNYIYDEEEEGKEFHSLYDDWYCPTCCSAKEMFVQKGGKKKEELYDIIIIGSGTAGMTAAIYAARYNLKTLIISEDVGGLMNDAYPVENYPGYISISGFELMQKFKEQVEALEVVIDEEEVIAIENGEEFTVKSKNKEFRTKSVIIATGSKRRKLGVPGEDHFKGKGVHYCAICDATLYKGKTVAVVGGSDSAAQSALLLAQHAKKVYIIYRKEDIRAEPIHKKRIAEKKNIEIIPNTNITEIKGHDFVSSVLLDKPYKSKKDFHVDGVFIEAGTMPSTEIAKKVGVALNEKGEIITNEKTETNIEGLFAAGDVTNDFLKQAVVAAGDGAKAAFAAYLHLLKKRREGK